MGILRLELFSSGNFQRRSGFSLSLIKRVSKDSNLVIFISTGNIAATFMIIASVNVPACK